MSVYGNHDGLVQGNLPRSFQFTNLATGSVKIVGLPAGASPADVMTGLQQGDPATVAALLGGPVRTVSADRDRRVLSRQQTIAERFRTAGTPTGHGYTRANLDSGRAYYAFDVPSAGLPVRGIVLDTVNPNGNSSGPLDQEQFAWLERELVANSRAYLAPDGSAVTGSGTDRLIMIFSHHTIDTMDNPIVFVDDPSPRVLGDEVRDLLLRFPNVVLWVNGHTHVNQVLPHARPAGTSRPGGFWEVNTASHIDWPQQARLLEVVDNRDGTLSIFGTIIDAAAPTSYGGRLDSPVALAALSRELAANDWQERGQSEPGVDGRRGSADARNVELVVATPYRPAAVTAVAPSSAATPAPAQPAAAAQQPAQRPQVVQAQRQLPVTGGAAGRDVVAAALTAAAGAGLALRGRTAPPPPERR